MKYQPGIVLPGVIKTCFTCRDPIYRVLDPEHADWQDPGHADWHIATLVPEGAINRAPTGWISARVGRSRECNITAEYLDIIHR